MYAVFTTGGKQYRATTGDTIKVEKLEAEKGSTIELDQVLLVGEGADVNVGTPLVDGGKVMARVVEHGRREKVKIIKFKRRKHHMKQMGHRQYYTMLEITGIEGAGAESEKPAKPAKAAAEKAETKKAAPKKAAAKKATTKKAATKKAETKKASTDAGDDAGGEA